MSNGNNSIQKNSQSNDMQRHINAVNNIKIQRKSISGTKTPGCFIETRPDGMDYVEEAYMREKLNEHYPVWSWKIDNSEFLGSEWAIVRGTLSVVDNGIPRTFSSIGAARVQFKRGQEHTAENVVDVDKNVASANTNAFKRAINRLCNICDDVYRKQVKDVSLSSDQIKAIKDMLDGLDDDIVQKIESGIKNQTINTSNINATINKIKRITEEKEKKDGSSK